MAGGVSANSRLRRELGERGRERGLPVFVPPVALATDNAAMIAAAGARGWSRPRPVRAARRLNAVPSLAPA